MFLLTFFNVSAQSFGTPVGTASQTSPGVYNLAAICNGAGAIWCTAPVSFFNSWELTFEASFNIRSGSGADGLCAVFGENLTNTSVNYHGGFLGYYNTNLNNPVPDFLNSFAVEVDIFNNGSNSVKLSDPSPYSDHVMIAIDGDYNNIPAGGAPMQALPGNTNLKDNQYHTYKIKWDCSNNLMYVYVDNVLSITSSYNYKTVFTTPQSVTWGFTGATASSCSDHMLRNISLNITDIGCGLQISPKALACGEWDFTGTSDDPTVLSYSWDFGDGNTATGNPVQHTYAVPGTYNVRLITSNAAGQFDTTNTNINVSSTSFSVPISTDTTICKGDTAQLSASQAFSYAWTPRQYLDYDTIPAPMAFPERTTEFTLYAADSNGCKDTAKVQVAVSDMSAFTVVGNQSICEGNFINLFARGARKYQWTPTDGLDNPFSSDPFATPDKTTTYVVYGEDQYGCSAKDSVTVAVHPMPDVSVIAEDVLLGCDRQQMQLYAATKPEDSIVSYSWFPEKYFDDPTKSSPIAKPDITTAVWLKVTNKYGCLNQDSALIRVKSDGFVAMPDAFTPNGDGLNETIYPYINCKIQMKEFNIYHRNGQRVFHTKTQLEGWDGTFKGQALDIGVYSYFVLGAAPDGSEVLHKGSFTLLR